MLLMTGSLEVVSWNTKYKQNTEKSSLFLVKDAEIPEMEPRAP